MLALGLAPEFSSQVISYSALLLPPPFTLFDDLYSLCMHVPKAWMGRFTYCWLSLSSHLYDYYCKLTRWMSARGLRGGLEVCCRRSVIVSLYGCQ